MPGAPPSAPRRPPRPGRCPRSQTRRRPSRAASTPVGSRRPGTSTRPASTDSGRRRPPGAGSGPANVSVSADLTSLSPGTTYHYRVVATNGSRHDARRPTGSSRRLRRPRRRLPPRRTRARSGPSKAALNGAVEPERALDDVVLRIRDEHGLRLQDAVGERWLGHLVAGRLRRGARTSRRVSPTTSGSSRRAPRGRRKAPDRTFTTDAPHLREDRRRRLHRWQLRDRCRERSTRTAAARRPGPRVRERAPATGRRARRQDAGFGTNDKAVAATTSPGSGSGRRTTSGSSARATPAPFRLGRVLQDLVCAVGGHRVGDRGRRQHGHRHGRRQPERAHDELDLRIRHDHELRLEDRDTRDRQRDGGRLGLRHRDGSEPGDDVPLPHRRLELGRHDARAGRHVQDPRPAGGGDGSGDAPLHLHRSRVRGR